MATYDFSTLPQVITITNVSSRAKTVQFYRTNLTQRLDAGDVLKIQAASSAEVFYYLAKADAELTVANAPVSKE